MAKKHSSSKNFEELIKPIVVLLAICIIIPLALAFTNSVTGTRISELEEKNQRLAMSRLIEADTYEQKSLETQDGQINYNIALKDDMPKGYIFTLKEKGYGGDITVMVAIDSEGVVLAIEITDASGETPGLGQNITKESFYGQFSDKIKGISILKNGAVSENNEVDAVAGATISSTAVTRAVNRALDYCEQLTKGGAEQ